VMASRAPIREGACRAVVSPRAPAHAWHAVCGTSPQPCARVRPPCGGLTRGCAASSMVCDALRDFGVQCVTPECLRLAKVEDHSSSVSRWCPAAAPRLPVRPPARPPLAVLQRLAALTGSRS
jgi:hypothetical protein